MADKSDYKEEVWSRFKDFQHVFLATTEGDQPRVRPVTLIYFDKRFWITTGTSNAKVKQIRGSSSARTLLSAFFIFFYSIYPTRKKLWTGTAVTFLLGLFCSILSVFLLFIT
jgi:hypothetical protein